MKSIFEKKPSEFPLKSFSHKRKAGGMMEKKRSVGKGNVYFGLLKRRLKNNPEDHKSLNRLASHYTYLHKYKKALAYHRKAAKLVPTNCEYLNDLALCYCYMKDYKRAICYLRKAIRLSQKNRKVCSTLSMVYGAMVQYYFKLGKRNKARKYIDNVIEYSHKSKNDDELSLLVFVLITYGDISGRDRKILLRLAKMLPMKRKLIYKITRL